MNENEIIDERFSTSWENITLANDYMFFKVMQDEKLLLELVRRIFPELDIEHIKLRAQKQVEIGADIKGVRLDIFIRDNVGRAITVEMQVAKQSFLPLRMRYYASMADMDLLDKGALYRNLPDSYIVFICMFDLFNEGLHKYTFRNLCVERNDISLDDGTTYILLNTKGTADDVDKKLKSVLDYLNGIRTDDEYVRQLDDAVMKGRLNKEWRRDYMTVGQICMDYKDIGREEGIRVSIQLIREYGGSYSDAVEKIASKFEISKAEADEMVMKYW